MFLGHGPVGLLARGWPAAGLRPMAEVVEVGGEAVRSDAVGPALGLHLEEAQLDADLEHGTAVSGSDLARRPRWARGQRANPARRRRCRAASRSAPDGPSGRARNAPSRLDYNSDGPGRIMADPRTRPRASPAGFPRTCWGTCSTRKGGPTASSIGPCSATPSRGPCRSGRMAESPVTSPKTGTRIALRLWQRPMNLKGWEECPVGRPLHPRWERALASQRQAAFPGDARGGFPGNDAGRLGQAPRVRGPPGLDPGVSGSRRRLTAVPAALPAVGPRIVEDAWKLTAYFNAHARRVHAVMAEGQGSPWASMTRRPSMTFKAPLPHSPT